MFIISKDFVYCNQKDIDKKHSKLPYKIAVRAKSPLMNKYAHVLMGECSGAILSLQFMKTLKQVVMILSIKLIQVFPNIPA